VFIPSPRPIFALGAPGCAATRWGGSDSSDEG